MGIRKVASSLILAILLCGFSWQEKPPDVKDALEMEFDAALGAVLLFRLDGYLVQIAYPRVGQIEAVECRRVLILGDSIPIMFEPGPPQMCILVHPPTMFRILPAQAWQSMVGKTWDKGRRCTDFRLNYCRRWEPTD